MGAITVVGKQVRGRWRRGHLLSGLGSAAALSLGLTTVLAAPALAVEEGGATLPEPAALLSISGTVEVPEGIVLAEGDVQVAAVSADAIPTDLDVLAGDAVTAGTLPLVEGAPLAW